MDKEKMRANRSAMRGPRVLGLPILYWTGLADELDSFAHECRYSRESLERETVIALQTRHREATVASPASGKLREVLELRLGFPRRVSVFYSVEADSVVVRGFSYDIDREPLDDRDGGFFYAGFWDSKAIRERGEWPDVAPGGWPRIYVASLADYNAGKLHGRWIDAAQDAAAVRAEIAEMLKASSEPVAEDWAIHDYEDFGGLKLDEFEDIDLVAEAARLIVEHGKVFAGLLQHFGGLSGMDEAKRYMEDGYRGRFESTREYMEELVEECCGEALNGLPDFIRYHIDFDGIADDADLNGDFFTVPEGRFVHVFDANV